MGLTENEQKATPSQTLPVAQAGLAFLQRTASLSGLLGSGFCPLAVISVISCGGATGKGEKWFL